MTRISRILSVATASLLILSVQAGAAEPPIKVGTIFPMSGPAGPSGVDATNAVNLQVEIINKKGGLLGRQLVVISKDDESTPAVGVSRANELIVDKVDVIFEGRNSPVALAMQPVIAGANILDITLSAKADQLLSGKGNPQAIRIISSNEIDAEVMAHYVGDILKAKRVAFMVQNDAYGNNALDVISQALKKQGIEVVASEKFPFKQTDFRVALTNVKSANPDAVIVINAATSGMPALINQYRQAGIQAQFVAGVTLLTPEVIAVTGESLTGIVSAASYLPNLEPLKDIAANQEFVEAYQKAYGRLPGDEAGVAAQAVSLWAIAVRQTKSLDKKTVAEAIRGKTVQGTNFGTVSFSPNGQMLAKPTLFRVLDGKAWRIELVK
jgi:branched-chain amino acid transport system substrate-binding protein